MLDIPSAAMEDGEMTEVEEAKVAKREYDRIRGKTRVNLGLSLLQPLLG